MPESDEVLLRRAAALVRERGKAATQGEWREDGHVGGDGFVVMADGVRRAHLPEISDEIGANYLHMNGEQMHNAAWIALVGPQLAEPLAAWLDDAAHWCSGGGQFIHSRSPTGRAVAVARALLGEPAMTVPVGDDRQEEK